MNVDGGWTRWIIWPVQWAYDMSAVWIMARPESPLVFTTHMLAWATLTVMRRTGF